MIRGRRPSKRHMVVSPSMESKRKRHSWLSSIARCKRTTQRHLESSTTTSNPNAPKPWTCDSTGYGAARRNTNSVFSGAPDIQTRPTTGPSITAQHTTSKNARKSSPTRASLPPFVPPLIEHLSLQQQPPHKLHTKHYIEVLKGCVRYPYLAKWEYGIPT